jgi:hypothetical protein
VHSALVKHFVGGAALVVSLVACGPPTAPGVTVAPGHIESAPAAPQDLVVRFAVLDAEYHSTVIAGALSVDLRDGPTQATMFAPPVCSARADVPASAFREDLNWLAVLNVTLTPSCPPQPPNVHRELTLTFTPNGAAALPTARYSPNAHEISLIADPWVPRQGRAPVVATPPTAPSGLRIGGWPVVVDAPGATTGPDPSPMLTAPDAQVVTNDVCSVTIARYASVLIGGASIRARLLADGNTLSVDEIRAASWRLEYEGSRGMGVNYGVTIGDYSYTCANTYATPERRACASAICATFRPAS